MMTLAAFGFNQPFFFTLLGIAVILLFTMALVGDADESEHYCDADDDSPDEIITTARKQLHLVGKRSTERTHLKKHNVTDRKSVV